MSTDDLDDRDLLAGLRDGDDSAFEALVRRDGGRLLATTRRLLRNEADAADAVQDAFLSAFRSLDSFGQQSSLSTWLHRIAVNAALMKIRTRERKPEESIEPLLPRWSDDGHRLLPAARWSEPPADAASRTEELELVRDAIDRLPDSYRMVLLLRDIEQFDTEETSRLLGISVNATKIRLHRARHALRTLLDPKLRETGTC